ncbi:MAG: HAD family hydrolase [Solibacillus sp.]
MHYIFDFDGTLADSENCSILATQAAFRACHLPVPTDAEIAHYMGIPIERSFKEMANRDFTEQAFDELLTTFRSYYQQFEPDTLQLFPGMMEVLQTLQQRGAKCFVVSSKKTDVLKRNLTALQIDGFFQDCIGSDQVKHYKPHPEGIFLLLERFRLQAADCVMIGDATFDMQMGKAANCRTCAVTWGSHTKELLEAEEPDIVVEQVLALSQIS